MTIQREDVANRHLRHELDLWLGGKDSLEEIAAEYHSTRQTFWRKFHPLFSKPYEPPIPRELFRRLLIVDAT